MKPKIKYLLLLFFPGLLTLAQPANPVLSSTERNAKALAQATIHKHTTNLTFEENKGQWEQRVKMKADLGGGRRLFFEEDRFTYVVFDAVRLYELHELEKKQADVSREKINAHAFSMKFLQANPNVTISGIDKKNFYLNYYLGNDRSRWASEVPVFDAVRYSELYPGIDLLGYSKDGQFKYDYIVAAGADPNQIKISFNGQDNLFVRNGTLYIVTSVGELVETIPYCYQRINGAEKKVACAYKLSSEGILTFVFPDKFDPAYDLVIDPVVKASTYTGSTANTFGHCATYDTTGNIYTGGRCFAQGYPTTTGAYQLTFAGNVDITISKFNPIGSQLLYSTYLGGGGSDFPHSLVVHTNMELYIYGSSTSTNYPVTSGCFQNANAGLSDMVVSKLNVTGTSLLGSTYVGGTLNDGLNTYASYNYGDTYRGEIVLDAAGNAFISGTSESTNFPVTSGAYDQSANGSLDAVVFKINPALTSMQWATYMGGSQDDVSSSLRLNSAGEVFFVGLSRGSNFPTTSGALSTTYNGGSFDGFVAKLNASGSSLLASTFVGSNALDIVYFIDLNFNGDVFLYGVSAGSMPISNGVYSNVGSQTFMMKLNSSLSSIMYATVLGSGQHTTFSPSAFMVDFCENIYMSGWGNATNYPITTNAIQSTTDVGDFYLMVLSQNAQLLSYATFYGSSGGAEHIDGGTSRFDPKGVVYQAVCECGGNFPVLAASVSSVNNSTSCDVAVFKIDFEVDCNPLQSNSKLCYGTNTTITVGNYFNLTNPSYTLMPGNVVSTTGVFSISPTSTSQYTLMMSGVNYLNAVQTGSGVATVSVLPAPFVSPSVIQSGCTSFTNSFNLNLNFQPLPVSYSINWSTIPYGVLSPTQTTSSGGILPGSYTAVVQATNGCVATAVFSIDPIPEALDFTVHGPREITCKDPVLNLTITPSNNTYTWSSLSAVVTGSSATMNYSNTGVWTIYGINQKSGCANQQTIAITQNTATPTSTVTPMNQTIDCSLTAVTTVTAYANPSVNVTHMWLSPMGGTLISAGQPNLYPPGPPGNYTHIAVSDVNGCKAVKIFTVFSTSGYPTYSVTSPQNFTLGCFTKSVATIDIINAQTTPPGGAVTYTLLSPVSNPAYTTSPQSSFTNVTVPGTYTVVTRDNTNNCESKLLISVLLDNFGPDLSVKVPWKTITCDYPYVVLKASSKNTNVNYNWSFPGQPGNLQSDSIRVVPTGNTSNTLVANYTLTIQDKNNTCISQTVIPVLQNMFAPKADFSGMAPISCKTQSVMLTNQSSSNIPPHFAPYQYVIAYTWMGPTPQAPQQLTTTYVARVPGTYTLVAKDLDNGCIAVATKTIDDFRNYPLVNVPEPPPHFILDCGSPADTIYPLISNLTPNLTYTWVAPPDVKFSNIHGLKTLVDRPGSYNIIVHNPASGCTSTGMVEIIRGELEVDFIAEPKKGFAPLSVTFTNQSSSSSKTSGTKSITTVWSFSNGKTLGPVSAEIRPNTLYTQPGTYTVTMFATKGSCIGKDYEVIEVDIPSSLEIPNVFTPNNDGVNDEFFVKADNLTEITAVITDRWGHMIYEISSSTGNLLWTGKNQAGVDVAEGVYLYIIKAKGSDGETYEQTGTITLLR